ncbi:MAG: HlyD family efflux transporter periplasmic adaptor subunit, partial [Oscillospiraceae bacterium]
DMADYTVMIAKIKVDEYDVSAIKEGKEVSVMVDSLDKEIKGTVGKFSKQATEKDGISYFTADIMLPQDASLLEGMSVEVKILNQSVENVQMISMKALQFDSENKPFVYVANEKGKMTTKPVKIGINDGVAVEIKEGIQADEKVYFPKVTITPMDMMGGE